MEGSAYHQDLQGAGGLLFIPDQIPKPALKVNLIGKVLMARETGILSFCDKNNNIIFNNPTNTL
jgi:hypothetical protein